MVGPARPVTVVVGTPVTTGTRAVQEREVVETTPSGFVTWLNTGRRRGRVVSVIFVWVRIPARSSTVPSR
jgi:hypothetical protein